MSLVSASRLAQNSHSELRLSGRAALPGLTQQGGLFHISHAKDLQLARRAGLHDLGNVGCHRRDGIYACAFNDEAVPQ